MFVPYEKPSPDLVAALTGEVAKANASGYRIKVAVIATALDLGGVPSLYNQPQVYARFLATELSGFYTGRVLVVMPAGFGIYANGAPTSAEESILAGVRVAGADPDSLTRAAVEAVGKLVAAKPPPAPGDHTPPTVEVFPAKAKRGGLATLRYAVSDASGKSRETIRVYGENLLLYATLQTRLAPAKRGTIRSRTWRVPRTVRARTLRFCVLARDPAGNQSRPACAPIRLA